ncbi:MAG TPA: shikimate dehydrogenase [Actinomycetota bacterium]|nr:shikimate dehydrogenase [Actinomycetota bacterium]
MTDAGGVVAGRPPIGGTTRTLGVIGWPVDQSLSPAIHNAAIAALGLDLVYVALPVAPGDVRPALEGLAALGFVGANVTMPHKTEASGIVDERSDDAARLDAVNTIVVTADGLVGHNTDAPGFDRMLRHDEMVDPAGRHALLYGAGGAARAVALALARGGAERVTVVVRDPGRAAPVVNALAGLDTAVEVVGFDEAPGVSAELLVNATPLGAHGEELPTPPLTASTTVIDLLYRPVLTPLIARARAAGATAAGGMGLLLHQAALSFELWTGQVPPLEVMSAAAVAAVGERP